MRLTWPPIRAAARGLAAALVVLFVAGLVLRQTNLLDRYLIFFPESEVVGSPGDLGLEFEDVFFDTSDGVRLHGWYVPGESEVTFLWLHGNAGNIGNRLSNLSMLHRHLGVGVFIFDYRGYGRSEGTISEQGSYLDAEAALAYLRGRRDVDSDRVVLFGRSLGAAVAVELASRSRPYAVILESPFTSIRAMAQTAYPYLPIGLIIKLVRTKYDSLSKIDGVHSPLMVLHGDRDDIVPIEIGRGLFEAANEPKRFYVIEGAGHNDTYSVGGSAYFDALRAFVDDLEAGAD